MADTVDDGDKPSDWSLPLFNSLPDDGPGEEGIGLSDYGKDLLVVSNILKAWLARAPEGGIRVDSTAGGKKIAALNAAHDSGFLSGAAEQPPPECLDAGIAAEVVDEDGSRSYELTDWGRRGIGAVLAASRAESRHVADAPRFSPSELSGLLRMAMPLLELPDDAEGVVEFGVDPDADDSTSSAARFWVRIEGGWVVATGEGPPPDA